MAGWQDEPLPASLEIGLDPRTAATAPGREAWLAGWRQRPEVTLIDDDREWLGQLETAVAVVRAVGIALVAGLLGAAIFTIASVIRLTAYLHTRRSGIMRLVGATEFFIRGPSMSRGCCRDCSAGCSRAAPCSAPSSFSTRGGRGSSLFATLLALDFLTLGRWPS